MVSTLSHPSIMPIAGESRDDFTMRAHRDLMASVPEPTDRNRQVWEAWSSVYGDSEQDRTDQRFSADAYQRNDSVCYFSEHEANSTGPDGQPMVRQYDATKLREIIDENNHRIADVDAYPTIVDRHTAPSGTRDPAPPETLGVAGPLRLGMIGRTNPRFAIFADEYIRKDKLSQMSTKGGRSVEVLTRRDTGRSYLNPIAAISEAPRLPLPVQFSWGAADDDFVDRYTAIAPMAAPSPAYPGGGNTHIDKFDSSTDPESSPQPNPESAMQGNEQLVRQIIDGIMNTEQMQWVTQQMGQGGTPAGGAPPAQHQPAQHQPPAQQQHQPAGQPDRFGAVGAGLGAVGGAMLGGPLGAASGAALGSQFAAGDDEFVVDHGENNVTADQYQAIVEGQVQLVNDLAASNQRVAQLEVAKADADRSNRLRELAARMPIDLDAEIETCLYSTGGSMDDERFETHIDTIERYAAKAVEQMPMVPVGALPMNQKTDHETAQYQAHESAVIRDLTNQYANQGVTKTYPELKAEAAERLTTVAK